MLFFGGIIYILFIGRFYNIESSYHLNPDLLTLVIAYLFLVYGHDGALLFALAMGIFTDLYSGGSSCMFTALYVAVFYGIYNGAIFFDINHAKGQIFLVFLVVVLKKILFFIMVTVFLEDYVFSFSFGKSLIISAAVSCFFAPLMFYFLTFLRKRII